MARNVATPERRIRLARIVSASCAGGLQFMASPATPGR
jgi:hypothetical protein